MDSRSRSFVVLGLTCMALVGPVVGTSYAQGQGQAQGQGGAIGNVIEGFYPSQAVRGQTTVLSLAFNGVGGGGGRGNPVQSVEITPADGITIGALKQGSPRNGVVWYDVPVTVAADAAPGPRKMIAVQGNVRTVPVTLMVPDHVPGISNLTITSSPTNGQTVDLQFAAVDQGGTFGEAPYVWFRLSCGNTPELGVVAGTVANGMIRASIPNPRAIHTPDPPSAGPKCDLDVHVTDDSNSESNYLKTTVEFK